MKGQMKERRELGKAHGEPPGEGSLAAELKDRGFGDSPARKTRRLTPTGS
jgi:hypothetical protein